MNEYIGTDKDIHVRIHKFVVSCFVNIVRKVPKTVENVPIIQQIASSLTSMGANDQEAAVLSAQIVDPYIKESQEILLIVSKIILNSKH
jgi:hypothetical protein